MKKIFLLLTISGLFISCGAFNKAEGHLHYSSTISTGQALIDLKEALDSGAINQAEYDTLKQRIKNNNPIIYPWTMRVRYVHNCEDYAHL